MGTCNPREHILNLYNFEQPPQVHFFATVVAYRVPVSVGTFSTDAAAVMG